MQFAEFVKLRNEKFGSVVFDTLKEKVYVTNETAGEILNLIKQGKSKEEIIDDLEENYRSDAETIEKEVSEFLQELENLKVVK
ncbi:MAG: HPr-rel-A system PqqD family peptide chaperone [Candidatus Omnitrophota bacterium]